MGLLTRAGDLVYTFRFLKLLVTKFEETDAFKYGIIDAEGKRIKSKKVESSDEKSAYTPFHRLVFNIKKLLAKAPGGSSKLASYAAALFLLKEKYNLSEKNLEKILKESGVDILDLLNEDCRWYVSENKMLMPGIYKLKNDKVLSSSFDEVVRSHDKVRIQEGSFPVGNILGIDVYEATHLNTGHKVHITLGEIIK